MKQSIHNQSKSPEKKWNSPFNIRLIGEMKKKAAVLIKKNAANNRQKTLTDAPDELLILF
jgi:hypothetical protein